MTRNDEEKWFHAYRNARYTKHTFNSFPTHRPCPV